MLAFYVRRFSCPDFVGPPTLLLDCNDEQPDPDLIDPIKTMQWLL
jgi:hypothetical protein